MKQANSAWQAHKEHKDKQDNCYYCNQEPLQSVYKFTPGSMLNRHVRRIEAARARKYSK